MSVSLFFSLLIEVVVEVFTIQLVVFQEGFYSFAVINSLVSFKDSDERAPAFQ